MLNSLGLGGAFCRLIARTAAAILLVFVPAGLPGQSDASLQMLLGNPSGATASISNPTNYLMTGRPQFAESYNNTTRIPNWVSWHLAPPDLGSATRTTSFYADTTLPSGWYQVTDGDYTGSGYDRGHNCPSADRTATAADNKALFYMTNIMPQHADNNQGPWEALETFTRNLVTASGQECYIYTCVSGSRGTIASGKVTIPSTIYKIIVAIPYASGDDLARINSGTTVIAVAMPNIAGIRSNAWTSYVTSVNAIESATGYHFFTALPAATQTALKSKIYGSATATPTPTPTPTVSPTPIGTPSMVIQQVYGGGGNSGAQYKNDYIVLFNRGKASQSLSGWSVQYASSAGTSWSSVALSGTVAAGKYYLVQMGPTGTTGAALPTPDLVGPSGTNLSATAGKVALSSTTTALSGSGCPLSSAVKDFLGYGGANCYEGASAAAGSNTTALTRASNGCTDTNSNSTNFTAVAPAPKNSATTANSCP